MAPAVLSVEFWICGRKIRQASGGRLGCLTLKSCKILHRLIKNIIFNKTEIFVGKNTLDHACQIFCSKSNGETMYHWFFLLEITVVKIMNNLNVCSAHSYLYPRAIYTHGLGLRIAVTYSRETRSEYYKNHFENSNFWGMWHGHVTYSFINMLLISTGNFVWRLLS
jgi:hypothetical protein